MGFSIKCLVERRPIFCFKTLKEGFLTRTCALLQAGTSSLQPPADKVSENRIGRHWLFLNLATPVDLRTACRRAQSARKNLSLWREGLEAQQRNFLISRKIFSDSIAKLVRACFPGVSCGYRTSVARDVAEWGIALIFLCTTKYRWWEGAVLGWLESVARWEASQPRTREPPRERGGQS